jgi:hypothetical protein
MIDSLSNEIIQKILKHLNLRDLIWTRQACRKLWENVDKLLLEQPYLSEKEDLLNLFSKQGHVYRKVLCRPLKHKNGDIMDALQLCLKIAHSQTIEIGEVFDARSARFLELSGNCRVQAGIKGGRITLKISAC